MDPICGFAIFCSAAFWQPPVVPPYHHGRHHHAAVIHRAAHHRNHVATIPIPRQDPRIRAGVGGSAFEPDDPSEMYLPEHRTELERILRWLELWGNVAYNWQSGSERAA